MQSWRCPAATESARAFWILFAGRLLDGVALSFIHVREPERAYIDLCLGAPPVALIASATSDERGPGHWALIPRAAEARASARAGLTGAEADALAAGDATFPNYIFLATYGYRFGVKKSSAGTALPCATEDGAGKDPLVKDPQ